MRKKCGQTGFLPQRKVFEWAYIISKLENNNDNQVLHTYIVLTTYVRTRTLIYFHIIVSVSDELKF